MGISDGFAMPVTTGAQLLEEVKPRFPPLPDHSVGVSWPIRTGKTVLKTRISLRGLTDVVSLSTSLAVVW